MRRPLRFIAVMTLAIAGDLAAREYAHFSSPGLFLLPAIAVTGMIAGMSSAFAAAAVSVVFVAIVYGLHGPIFQAPWDRLVRLGIMCVSAPLVALIVGLLHRRSELALAGQLQSERDRSFQRARTFELEKASLLTRDQLSQQRANDLIGSIPGVVWETALQDDRLTITYISSFAVRLLGYPTQSWTANPNFWLDIIHPDDRPVVSKRISSICALPVASSEIDLAPLEFRWMAQSGSPVWVETRLVRLLSPSRCVGFRAVTLDINQRKQLEQALRDRATQLVGLTDSLKQSNQELDQFAYVTSHDLKSPLRGISNLSHWIEEDLGDRFTPQAREQMRLLRGRVHRMEALINGLLEYSHVGRTQGKTQHVDTAALLGEVIDWIAAPPDIRIQVQSGMPVFTADRLRLQQVFTNLLENAVKHRGSPAGRIAVCCDESGGFYRFSVSDDGPGIDPRYHERIFGIFQTLLPRDQVEGTGIGLSLVKKIVQSKGGTVWLQSQSGRGATFSFTWPKVETGAR